MELPLLVLSIPCHPPKRGVQDGSRIPACFSSSEMGLQETAAEKADCSGQVRELDLSKAALQLPRQRREKAGQCHLALRSQLLLLPPS